jgi:hypothetical protein
LLGGGNSFPVQYMDSWFIKEQIPKGWKPIAISYGKSHIISDMARLAFCYLKLMFS